MNKSSSYSPHRRKEAIKDLIGVNLCVICGEIPKIQLRKDKNRNCSCGDCCINKLSSNNLGKYEGAVEWYDKALKIDPNNVDAFYNKHH